MSQQSRDTLRYGCPAGDTGALDQFARACALAFGGDEAGVHDWIGTTGHEHLRVLRDGDGTVQATLLVIPMGQHFGGRSIPLCGIAGVAVPPESRGRGTALRLMQESVREAARAGTPLSGLYASTQALYRKVGYEQAGLRFRTTIPLRTIGVRDRSLAVRELSEGDQQAIRDCYSEFARNHNGTLDRGPYIWNRIRSHRERKYRPFGIVSPDDERRIEGYLYMAQKRNDETGRHDLILSDLAFTTGRAGRRLLGLLADFATVGDDAILCGPPIHPICSLMPQQFHSSRFLDAWMLRINLVGPALEARGYPAGLDASLALDITDDLVPDNVGPWTVRVRDGRASAERGGEHARGNALRCDIRALACIYAGLYSATQAASLGMLEGDTESLAIADAVFAGPTPWMNEQY